MSCRAAPRKNLTTSLSGLTCSATQGVAEVWSQVNDNLDEEAILEFAKLAFSDQRESQQLLPPLSVGLRGSHSFCCSCC